MHVQTCVRTGVAYVDPPLNVFALQQGAKKVQVRYQLVGSRVVVETLPEEFPELAVNEEDAFAIRRAYARVLEQLEDISGESFLIRCSAFATYACKDRPKQNPEDRL